ncbi:hypothetical protein [Roseospira goensis]|uniref:Uncharacterized protein n=1 Tax=Roseospira goensis TaxID=391922 RepID=A0A7W6S269_9PROT|nr:hypothetical protein [Roseospira goensis]MBB4287538.1 hypothetical protein [Roseospira goensis]
MSQDDWVLFFAAAVCRGRREAERSTAPADASAEAVLSDRALVRDAHRAALAHGETEARAWRAAVGAYLVRHPGAELGTAERIVTFLMRPEVDSPALTGGA